MPSELGCVKRSAENLVANKKSQDNHVLDLLDAECTSEEDDLEDDYDEELEFAYQCDFQKKRPNKPCSTNSLLTNLLSTSSTPTGAKTEQCNSVISTPLPSRSSSNGQAGALSVNSTAAARNLEWEHWQHSLSKYQRSRRTSNNDVAWTDNFSKY
ncbi:hypothetical protein MBANPS3_009999 [Mucor bainieri]